MIQVNAEQREAIQELINIGFGKAMSALAEVLNTHVTLNVPVVEVVRPRRLAEILGQALGQDCTMTLVRQNFQGEFFGEAILSLPTETSRMLCSILDVESGFQPEMDLDKLELEGLLEMGNIIIGACLGQFAELLNTHVSFSAPRIYVDSLTSDRFRDRIVARTEEVMLIHTSFGLVTSEVRGYLCFFLSLNCLNWLLKAADRFLNHLKTP